VTEKYRLKRGQESFQVVDGPLAGRKFERGKEYREDEIPPEEEQRFEAVKPPAPAAARAAGARREARARKPE